jgi:hypothetical protein
MMKADKLVSLRTDRPAAHDHARIVFECRMTDDRARWIPASQMPNDPAQFALCSLFNRFPLVGQEIDCKMQLILVRPYSLLGRLDSA